MERGSTGTQDGLLYEEKANMEILAELCGDTISPNFNDWNNTGKAW